MDVLLAPELNQFVAEKMADGHYSSPSEVVSEALRLLKEQEELRRIRLDDLRQEIQKGLDQSERGEVLAFDSTQEILDHIRKEGAMLRPLLPHNT